MARKAQFFVLCAMSLAALTMIAGAGPTVSGLAVVTPGGTDIRGGKTIDVQICETFCITPADVVALRAQYSQPTDGSGDANIVAFSGNTKLMDKDPQNEDDTQGSQTFSINLDKFSGLTPNAQGFLCYYWCENYKLSESTRDQEDAPPSSDHDDHRSDPDTNGTEDGTEEMELYGTKTWTFEPEEVPGHTPDGPHTENPSGITPVTVKDR